MQISYYVIPGIGEKGITTREHLYERVTRLVCQHLEVPFKELFKKNRKREVCLARHISMYIIRTHYPTVTLVSLGNYFCGRDHTSVVHGVQVIKNLMWSDPELKRKVEYLEGFL